MRCEEVREVLPAHVKDGSDDLTVRRHLARCPQCKAELARYESLMGGLRTLQTRSVEVPAGLFDQLLAIPERSSRLDSARHHVARHRKVYVGGGIAAVALAGAAGAALWRSKAKRPVTA